MTKTPMIQIRNLNKWYGEFHVLRGIFNSQIR